MCVCVIGESCTVQRVQKYLYLTLVSRECPGCLVKALLWASLCPEENTVCSCCLCPWATHQCMMGPSAVILSLLSSLNIRFSFSLEKKCWNGYRLMNCRLDKSVCVCVSDQWRVKNGSCDWVQRGQLNRETPICENVGDFFTTHTLLCFWRTIYYMFALRCPEGSCLQYLKWHISVEMHAECQSLFYSVGNTK